MAMSDKDGVLIKILILKTEDDSFENMVEITDMSLMLNVLGK